MKCIYCNFEDSKVLDSRLTDKGNSVKRRRECLSCGKRFTTYEMVEVLPILVIKNDGTRQPFDRVKVQNGIVRACEKRAVSLADINNLVHEIEDSIQNSLASEVKTVDIGEMVMKGLKDLDEVAYIRFASVYKQFADVSTFLSFVKEFEKKIKK
ncbi:MAG: transcriptional regulator NrdR [Firmicutes bacterium]|nr:transcriptional regulator NrdR [Bacillota bacterium]MCL2256005.1 transcriptional regulator NrdR [Bacillota bacterium]